MKLSLVVCVVAVGVALGHEGDDGRQKRMYPTRCYPGSHCYPSQEDIEIFKDQLSGSVYVPSDTAYFSSVASGNARWQRNPGLVVIAATTKDVQTAVLFAREFYLNLVYSASSVDYTGRGFYDGSLRLDLSQLKSISTSDLTQFLVAGTATVSVGSTWGEVYSQIEASGRSIAGGDASLDNVDTFTMTGGLGPLSRTLGLASDNLLSAQVVLANGNLASVNPAGVTVTDQEGTVKTYEDPDLFRALRGGGITWAVPVSFTFGLALPPGQYSSISASYRIVDDGVISGRSVLRQMLQNIGGVTVQWGGHISIDGSPSATFPNDKGVIKYNLFSYGFYDFFTNQQNNIFTNIEQLRNIVSTGVIQTPTTNSQSSFAQFRSDATEVEQHFTDKPNQYVFNTLMNSDVITDQNKLDALVDLMMDTVNAPTPTSNWRCVARLAGGRVSSPNTATYVSEKLRDALFSWTCALMWDDGVIREDYYIQQALAFQARLRALGNGGVDPYYASEDLMDWRTALYGNKYFELLEVKKRWDIDNYLWAHNQVGSDFELNCRGIRCPHHH